MLCGQCDRCISMATGTDVKPRHKFGLFPLTANCQLKNGEILLFGGDYLQTYTELEDREDYKAGVAAERERCSGIARRIFVESIKIGKSDVEWLRSLIRHTLDSIDPEEGNIGISRQQEIEDEIRAEREACAKLVEEQQCDGFSYIDKALVSVAKMIRKRSK